MPTRLRIFLLALIFGLLTLIPYLTAYQTAGDGRFAGFLLNPADGASYLAKMRQGWEGNWLYTLAFTDTPGPGALIFAWYLLLGHIARLTALPLMAVWHIARIAGAAAFLFGLWEFLGRLGQTGRVRAVAWAVAAFGSGLGWLALPAGGLTSDLWVPEYIPLYGMLTSAHFPLATALILLLVIVVALPQKDPRGRLMPAAAGIGFGLGAIQPFAILPVGLALSAWILLRRVFSARFPDGSIRNLLAAGAGIAPWVLYDLWVVRSSPQLASWYAQNQTPTAPVWDLALSLGLPGVVCLIMLVRWFLSPGTIRDKFLALSSANLLLGLWLLINLLLLFAPFSLQRRLMLGMWIPLAALAAPHLVRWIFRPVGSILRGLAVAAALIPSALIFLLALFSGIDSQNRLLFLKKDEADAVDWLAGNAGPEKVVLAEPEITPWLPGMAGVRVVYGHPMETPFADGVRMDVMDFFGNGTAASWSDTLTGRAIDFYLYTGTSFADLSNAIPNSSLVFSTGKTRLYKLLPVE
jgi:hypothetical protein